MVTLITMMVCGRKWDSRASLLSLLSEVESLMAKGIDVNNLSFIRKGRKMDLNQYLVQATNEWNAQSFGLGNGEKVCLYTKGLLKSAVTMSKMNSCIKQDLLQAI